MGHDLPGHPETAARALAIEKALAKANLTQETSGGLVRNVSRGSGRSEDQVRDTILAVHSPALFGGMRKLSADLAPDGVMNLDIDTYATPSSFADLVKAGKLAFVPLHSAHWAVPFMICMQEKAAQDALAALPEEKRAAAKVVYEGRIQWKKAGEFDRNFAPWRYEFDPDGNVTAFVQRPNCVFPRCCGPGQPAEVRIIHRKHPICQGVPPRFTLDVTEMYDEPFGVPEPDTVLFTENWKGGEFFRSGCLWQLGKGLVFYYRPGDQQYPVIANAHLLKLLENAALWLGDQVIAAP